MSLKNGAFLLGLFTFLFYQNIFCMFADVFCENDDDARIRACFEYMSNPIWSKPLTSKASAPTPMEIERGSDFVDCKKDACDGSKRDINQSAAVSPDVVVEYDKDGDVVMKERAKQNISSVSQFWQKKLLHWMALYTSKKVCEANKKRLFNWLSDNWELIKQCGLRDWFLTQLLVQSEKREELLVVWKVFVLK